jgi:GDPmannose 4,6-dehydratase
MRALITGAAGQDGTILSTMLARQGAQVVGLVKPATNYQQLLRYVPDIQIAEVDLSDTDALRHVVREASPTHIWNFGGFTAPGESWDHQDEVRRINVDAVEALLSCAAELNTAARVFQASSSHIYEGTDRSPQTEDFELSPHSPYAQSKAAALRLVREYREKKGLFAVSGILYNHESPLRGENFVTRKVSKAVARISAGQQEVLELGDIEVARDWGWAPDYVRAMLLMLQAHQPQDFVLATGISHRLSYFVAKAFLAAGVTDWQDRVISSPNDRPSDTNKMVGDSKAAYVELGWRHTVDFDSIAERMVRHDLDLLVDPSALWVDF